MTAIREAIGVIKGLYVGGFDEASSRDQVLWGEGRLDEECTGVACAIWASVDVVRQAAALGCNLLVSHESLFYHHNAAPTWLAERDDATYCSKARLLDDAGMVVWRNHDYVHSGIVVEGEARDGIVWGLLRRLGWEGCVVGPCEWNTLLEVSHTTVPEVACRLRSALGLDGIRVAGCVEAPVRRVLLCGHLWGDDDRHVIERMEADGVDLLVPGETVDFSVMEYLEDCACLGRPRAAVMPGHFALEQPGMEYMAGCVGAALGGAVPVAFVDAGSLYRFPKSSDDFGNR